MREHAQYRPDGFVILKISTEDGPLYKVFAGWAGGYTQGDSWKINSGITRYTKDGNVMTAYGYSGSAYVLHFASENRLTAYNRSVLTSILKDADWASVEVISVEKFFEEFKENEN